MKSGMGKYLVVLWNLSTITIGMVLGHFLYILLL